MITGMKIILGSQSRGRKSVLERMGFEFEDFLLRSRFLKVI